MPPAWRSASVLALFEKHFTLDRNIPGPDHWFSENPDDPGDVWIKAPYPRGPLVDRQSDGRCPLPQEREMRKIARRSVVAVRDIALGERLSDENVALRRPGTGLPPEMLQSVLGRAVTRKLKAGELLNLGDFE